MAAALVPGKFLRVHATDAAGLPRRAAATMAAVALAMPERYSIRVWLVFHTAWRSAARPSRRRMSWPASSTLPLAATGPAMMRSRSWPMRAASSLPHRVIGPRARYSSTPGASAMPRAKVVASPSGVSSPRMASRAGSGSR